MQKASLKSEAQNSCVAYYFCGVHTHSILKQEATGSLHFVRRIFSWLPLSSEYFCGFFLCYNILVNIVVIAIVSEGRDTEFEIHLNCLLRDREILRMRSQSTTRKK